MNNVMNENKKSFAEQLISTLDRVGGKVDVQYLCSAPRIRSDEPKVIYFERNSVNVERSVQH